MTQIIDVTGLADADVTLIRQLAERMKPNGELHSHRNGVAKPGTPTPAEIERVLNNLAELGRDITHAVEFDRGDVNDRDTP